MKWLFVYRTTQRISTDPQCWRDPKVWPALSRKDTQPLSSSPTAAWALMMITSEARSPVTSNSGGNVRVWGWVDHPHSWRQCARRGLVEDGAGNIGNLDCHVMRSPHKRRGRLRCTSSGVDEGIVAGSCPDLLSHPRWHR